MKFVPGPDNAIAVSLSGTVTGDDLSQIMDRLELALNIFNTVDVFIETHEIKGLEVSALAAYAARALPLFGALRAFDRVAVVADQAWIRLATRLESAILPLISYRIFKPEHRAEAMAWAFHRDETSARDAQQAVGEIDRAA
ncbi:STAS/SEC14 domain-containing protein [Novosphingobium sp. Gsoil 351]|uniref:STAS/SEC14 domain-containing protein n=1 Tax=Novosphingobium sp. Gsoil 351 TaxID=2675225 RepID=UPI001E43FD1B|nr:STAS/SEC14 domain-containing protein [Novosphingobium sp. Gsoil 351]